VLTIYTVLLCSGMQEKCNILILKSLVCETRFWYPGIFKTVTLLRSQGQSPHGLGWLSWGKEGIEEKEQQMKSWTV